MQSGLLQADVENRGIVFDPRTKMFLLLTIAIFVLGGAGGPMADRLLPYLKVPGSALKGREDLNRHHRL